MSALKPLEDAVAAMPESTRIMVEMEIALVTHQMRKNAIFAAAVVLAVVHEARELVAADDAETAQRRDAILNSLDQNFATKKGKGMTS